MPFGQRKRAKCPLDIIHSDICGPINPSTWDNKRYYITFLDDYINYTMVYLLETKSEALEKFKEYAALVETKWNKKIINLRGDNGGEYTSREFKDWCKRKGININYTAPYSPQLNGKAERLNRILVEKARALLYNQENAKELWGEAIRVAAFLYNRSPNKTNNETAFEIWNGEKPNLKSLKIFGCKAYAKEMGQLKKLDKRSNDVIFGETAKEGRKKDKNLVRITSERKEENEPEEEPEESEEDNRQDIKEEDEWDTTYEDEEDSDREDQETGTRKNRQENPEERPNPHKVISSAPLRIILALAAVQNYHFVKFDIKTAFLYGEIQEEVYTRLPEGFEEDKGKICKLKKALYGLKQAPKRWNEKFTKSLKHGLDQLPTENCLFKRKDGTMFVAIHIDDGFIVGKRKEEIRKLIENLKKEFKLTEEEDSETYLGLEIEKKKENIKLSQEIYTKQVFEAYGMKDAKSAKTPLLPERENKTENVRKTFPYRQAKGSLLYLTTKTRPDLSYAVNYYSRYIQSPESKDFLNVKRIFRYLQNTKELGLVYGGEKDTEKLTAYCDSDYAGDPETRKSTTGYVIKYCGGPVSWCSRKQPIVALSSTEAEFISAAECCKELLYLKAVLEKLINKTVKAEMQIDNQSAIHLIKKDVLNRRSKHIDVRFRFIQEKVAENNIVVKYCSSENQPADILTKPLSYIKFEKHRENLVA
ncbi:integrase core domain protein [Lasius niger]|uniref:Integrase core domain protein n=1 Tax=Lasius niger TaxID=67767 RepID=A0A0J7KC73_LASNI|nr:integrase core domain protein [Lasius niger]